MSYQKYVRKQYNIDLLRHPTLIIFSPKIIKKTLLFDITEKTRQERIKLQLINTKLIKQLIKNSKFAILQPLLNGPIMIGYSTEELTITNVVNAVHNVSSKLIYNGAILGGRTFITAFRLNLIDNNEHQSFYAIFLIYHLYLYSFIKNLPSNLK